MNVHFLATVQDNIRNDENDNVDNDYTEADDDDEEQ